MTPQPSPIFQKLRDVVRKTGQLHVAFPEPAEYVSIVPPVWMDFQEIYREILPKLFSITEEQVVSTFPLDPFGHLELVDDYSSVKGTGVKIYLHVYSPRLPERLLLDRVRRHGPRGLEGFEYRCALIGSLFAEEGGPSFTLNGRIKLDCDMVVNEWLEACGHSMWVSPRLTRAGAEKLAEAVIEYTRTQGDDPCARARESRVP